MKLKEYIETSGDTVAQYADLIGISVRAVWRYMLPPHDPRAQIPHRAVMRRIFIQTGGKVRPDDFYDLPDLSTLSAERAA